MAEGGPSDPFSIFDQLTEARAAMETEDEIKVEAGIDTARIKREVERRERLGTLRARVHTGKRSNGARPVFGHVNLY